MRDCRFVVDENLPQAIAGWLSSQGFWAEHITQVSLRGASDDRVFRYAQQQGAILVTRDKGFGDERRFPSGTHCGIILLRLKDWRRQNILKRLQEALSQLKGRSLQGKLVIVGEAKVRVR
jgi:predicted nuclease of predicted toxin-antitoxin system